MFHVKHSRGTLLALALVGALAAAVASGLLYPDDNGYSLTQHYFSDLGMTVTYGGENNRAGAFLFFVACSAFAYSVWRFAWLFAGGARRRRVVSSRKGEDAAAGGASVVGRLGSAGVLIGGGLTAVFFFLTGLTPKNLLFDLHNWVSYSAFLALLLLWVSGTLIAPSRSLRVLHASMVLLSAGYLTVLFSTPSWEMPEGWALQVVAQKTVVIGNWLGMLLGALLLPPAIVSRET